VDVYNGTIEELRSKWPFDRTPPKIVMPGSTSFLRDPSLLGAVNHRFDRSNSACKQPQFPALQILIDATRHL
jgi:hypothetical protein